MTLKRYTEIDQYRGLILVLMALDHVTGYVMRFHYNEYWTVLSYPYHSTTEAVLRFMSHLCAPGFFLIMGISMVLWTKNHAHKVNENQVRRHFVERSIILIVLQMVVVNPIWLLGSLIGGESLQPPGNGDHIVIYFGVIASLGASMLIWAWLINSSSKIIILLVLTTIVVSLFMVPGQEMAKSQLPVLQRLFFVPGKNDYIMVMYSIAPWMGLTGLGILYGRYYDRIELKEIVLISLLLLLIYIAYKFSQTAVGENSFGQFIYEVKYPPSIGYLSLTIMITVIALYGLKRINGNIKWLSVFGKSPLFFYVVHLLLYITLVFMLSPSRTAVMIFTTWILGLLIMYRFCGFYIKKRELSDSNSWLKKIS